MDIEFRTALEMPLEAMAATATRGFEGYFVPIHLDATAVWNMVRVDSVDLSASVAVWCDGQPAGVAFVARRGWSCRLATMSMAPQFRGQRIGSKFIRHLLDAARQRGDRQFVLECIEQNETALRLYRAAGFREIRRLVGYTASRVAAKSDPALTEINPAEAALAVAKWGAKNLPWPMDAQTLAALAPPHRGYRLGSAWTIITNPAEATVTIRTLVVESAARRRGFGRRIVGALAGAFPGKAWRLAAMIPEELPETFFARLGFQRSAVTQLQMEQARQAVPPASDLTAGESRKLDLR